MKLEVPFNIPVILFIFIPLSVFFSYKIFYQKYEIKKIIQQLREKVSTVNDKNYFNLVLYYSNSYSSSFLNLI